MRDDVLTSTPILDRVRASVACLNENHPEKMLEAYADDVIVTTPIYRAGDSGETIVCGKAAFRGYLLKFIEKYRSFEVTEAHAQGNGFVATIELAGGPARVAYTATFNWEGLVRTVMIFGVD